MNVLGESVGSMESGEWVAEEIRPTERDIHCRRRLNLRLRGPTRLNTTGTARQADRFCVDEGEADVHVPPAAR